MNCKNDVKKGQNTLGMPGASCMLASARKIMNMLFNLVYVTAPVIVFGLVYCLFKGLGDGACDRADYAVAWLMAALCLATGDFVRRWTTLVLFVPLAALSIDRLGGETANPWQGVLARYYAFSVTAVLAAELFRFATRAIDIGSNSE